jgi:hypothetical protein
VNQSNFIINFSKPNPKDDALKGLWFRYEPGGLGAPVRFYYFHGNGNGLYRYGRQGYTNTNSYDYEINNSTLTLNFRKTGVEHKTTFSIETKDGLEWLTLQHDPKEPGARYFKERQQMSEPHLTDWSFSLGQAQSSLRDQPKNPAKAPAVLPSPLSAVPSPSGFMWIEATDYETGGFGFAIYQFREAGIDGRGTGWYHQGDFNDWSTESLLYRIYQDHLDFAFELRPEKCSTHFSITSKEKKRSLHINKDPRNFWHRRSFEEMGKSF